MKKRNRIHSERGRATAFTLVELLVVIAIIGVLIALLLPAVQAAREAARRMQCTNHLKQIMLGMHNYHDVHQSLPTGALYFGASYNTGAVNLQRRINWAISVLPFIEQSALFDLYDPGTDPVTSSSEFTQARITTYFCPSNPFAGTLLKPASFSGLSITSPASVYTCSYKAIAGSGAHGNTVQWGTDKAEDALAGMFPPSGPRANAPTAKHVDRYLDFSAVTDGLSNTFGIGEYATRTVEGRHVFWCHTYMGQILGGMGFSSFHLIPDYQKCIDSTSSGTLDRILCDFSYAGEHPGVMNFAVGDGSIRSVSTTVNLEIFQAYGSVSNGENLSL